MIVKVIDWRNLNLKIQIFKLIEIWIEELDWDFNWENEPERIEIERVEIERVEIERAEIERVEIEK